MHFIKKKRQGYILLEAALAMIVVGMLSTSIFTIFSGQFSMIQASRTALAAQQYAEIDANTLRLLSYDDLDNKGAHTRQGITSVADADGWQDEIVVGAEKTIDADAESKQRIATIKIYKTGDTLSRYSLQVPLSSQGSGGGGVPVGTVITWPLDSMPSGSDAAGKWLECNGQSVNSATYPKLAVLMSNVPNYQGVFLRGLGSVTSNNFNTVTHQSGVLGELQGDTIRNITGGWATGDNEMANSLWGAFYHGVITSGADVGAQNDSVYASGTFDASLVVPTSNENRPVNKAVRYLIKAK